MSTVCLDTIFQNTFESLWTSEEISFQFYFPSCGISQTYLSVSTHSPASLAFSIGLHEWISYFLEFGCSGRMAATLLPFAQKLFRNILQHSVRPLVHSVPESFCHKYEDTESAFQIGPLISSLKKVQWKWDRALFAVIYCVIVQTMLSFLFPLRPVLYQLIIVREINLENIPEI